MECFMFLVLIALAIFFLKTTREGFSPSFNKCRAKGYSKEFCVQTPTTHLWPGTCQCPNGMMGRILPGFGGKCVC